jgi:hypothetical protein
MKINMKYEIIKKIKSGGQGSIYKIKYKHKMYALKIEKVLETEIKKNYASVYWREIEFAKTMNNKYPDLFMTLYDYDIIQDCNFKLDNPYNIEQINNMNKSVFCSRKIYEYIDVTLDKIINKLKLRELYSIIIQLSYIIYTMNKNGYTHNDLHIYNIGVIKTSKKYITIFGYKIPTYGRIIKLLDYGSVLHKKYKLSKSELIGIDESKILSDNKINEIRRILYIAYDLPFYSKVPVHFWETYDYDKDLQNFINSNDSIVVNDLVNDDHDKYDLFMLLYPEKFQKRILNIFKLQYKKTINNNIRLPTEDIIFLLNSTHIKSYNDIKIIILYFINKLIS